MKLWEWMDIEGVDEGSVFLKTSNTVRRKWRIKWRIEYLR